MRVVQNMCADYIEPLTVFPICFASNMTDEAKLVLNDSFENLMQLPNLDAMDILLNFVQTAFDYKTDE